MAIQDGRERDPGGGQASGNGDRDPQLKLARRLGEFLDRCSATGSMDVDRILKEQPEIASELGEEIDTLREIDSIVQDSSPDHVFGDFRILREAGRGGMGIVYEAWQVSLGRRVALKILPSGFVPDSKALLRFKREAMVAAKLSHPNVVGVYASGFEGGTPYYAMEFADGETLQQLVRRSVSEEGESGDSGATGTTFALETLARLLDDTSRGGPGATTAVCTDELDHPTLDHPTPREAGEPSTPRATWTSGGDTLSHCRRIAELFAGAAEGVQHAHANGIIHRDLKPSNIIVDSSGRMRILDFGVARVEGLATLTLTEERLGTPLYMSPEQAQDPPGPLGPGVDIYSLGASLYETLGGRPPFEGRNYRQILDRIVNQDPRPLHQLNARVPADLNTIALKCLRKDPRERYATAEGLAQDLRRFARGDPIEARPQSTCEMLLRRLKRNRRRILEGVGILVLLLSVCALSYKFLHDHREAKERSYSDAVRQAVLLILKKQLLSPSPWRATVVGEKIPVAPFIEKRRSGNLLDPKPDVFEAGSWVADVGRDPVQEAVERLRSAVSLFPDEPIAYYHLARGLLLQGRGLEARRCLDRALESDRRFVPALSLLGSILKKERDPQAEEVEAAIARTADDSGISWQRSWLEAHGAVLEHEWAPAAEAFDQLSTIGHGREEPYLGFLIETLLGGGVAYLKAGNFDAALQAFRAGKLFWPDWIEPAILLGKVYYLKGQSDKAASIFRDLYETVKTAGESPSAGDDVAREVSSALSELGNFEGALRWAERMREEPTRSLMMAEYLCRLRRFDAAANAGWKALRESRRPSDRLAATISLGNVLMARGETEGASRWYARAMEMAPADPRTYVAMGVCLEAGGDLERALGVFLEAVGRVPGDGRAQYNLARVLSKLERNDEAIVRFQKAIELDPGNALAFNHLGTLFDQRGDGQRAREMYEKATELAPELGLARFNLAWTYHRELRYAEAVEQYSEAIRLGQDGALLRCNLGNCLHGLRRYDDAVPEYRKAIETDPTYVIPHHDLGTVLELTGRRGEAIESYRRALALDPSWVKLRYNLAEALEKEGQVEEAVEQYRAIFEIDPKYVWAHNSLATLLLRNRAPAPAGDDLRQAIARLEAAERLVHADVSVRCLLMRYRDALLPDLATYDSIDALIEGAARAIPWGATWSFHRGGAEPSPGLEWAGTAFEDSGWESGPAGFGYAGNHGLRTVLADMRGNYTTLYLRRRFAVSDPQPARRLLLQVRADAGFVAYLNGEEVARVAAGNEGTRLARDAVADAEQSDSWRFRDFHLDPRLLVPGENVLALQGLNLGAGDSDFYLDASLEVGPLPDARKAQRAMDSLRAFREAAGPDDGDRLAYLEGRIHQLAGDSALAAARYREAIDAGASGPGPFLRLAECLREEGDAGAGERILHQALESGLTGDDRLWDAWLHSAMVLLDRPPQQVLKSFAALSENVEGELDGHLAELAWLLERLAAKEPIRINCGGTDYASEGVVWGRDRFARGGRKWYLSKLDREGLADAALYRTERFYNESGRRLSGYRVPLPSGDYRVTLYFVEGYFKAPQRRRFDILLEGDCVLADYEPFAAGFGVPEARRFEVTVSDGALDIEFGRRVENPKVSAIEIERL